MYCFAHNNAERRAEWTIYYSHSEGLPSLLLSITSLVTVICAPSEMWGGSLSMVTFTPQNSERELSAHAYKSVLNSCAQHQAVCLQHRSVSAARVLDNKTSPALLTNKHDKTQMHVCWGWWQSEAPGLLHHRWKIKWDCWLTASYRKPYSNRGFT